ncbi:hypothetical protein QFC19_001988 [Naganishia cerealis]|uniref:Uncharacterized protein n=1 Tax=Naganishia cerealis TaxID=610337 RepID=A0ACC2WEC7_9TREE|nr:hypothetical protein QFC19_001988 [Naganishia cerealis]
MILSVNSPPELDLALSDLIWSGVFDYEALLNLQFRLTSISLLHHTFKASDNESMSPDISLITVRNSGFIGKMRLQYRQHCIVDTHPDSTHTLRLDRPFQELKDFAIGLDMESMDSMEHSHIPYVILLVRAMERFKTAGHVEVTYDNLDAFKETLLMERRALDEENFEEAESQAFRSRNFWLLIHALKQYTLLPQSEGLLPISASLPDMKASTTDYVHLQNLYKNKANADLRTFKDCVKTTLSSVGLDDDAIDDEETSNFVKNCHSLQCIDGRSLKQEYETDVKQTLIADELSNGMHMNYYLGFKACERYYIQNQRWPASDDEGTTILTTILPPLLREVADLEDSELSENAIREIVRGGFGCLPTTSAFIGGIVAQEAIKLITAQYVPLDNTCIIDLVKSSLEKFRL